MLYFISKIVEIDIPSYYKKLIYSEIKQNPKFWKPCPNKYWIC